MRTANIISITFLTLTEKYARARALDNSGGSFRTSPKVLERPVSFTKKIKWKLTREAPLGSPCDKPNHLLAGKRVGAIKERQLLAVLAIATPITFS